VPDRPPRFLSDRRSVHAGTPNTWGLRGLRDLSLSSPYKGSRDGTLDTRQRDFFGDSRENRE
jgi:hypothetical protein